MKKIIFLLLLSFTSFAQNGWYNGWGLRGNALSSNTNFIGTTTNRSFILKTNSVQHMKVDSVGNFEFHIDTVAFNKVPFIINGGNTVNGNNPYLQLKGYYIGAYRILNSSTGVEWYMQNNTVAGATKDNFFIGNYSNPGLSAMMISTLTSVNFANKVRIGSLTTLPTATLDVTGTMSVSSTSTLNGLQLASGSISVTSKGIDVTAGDAATINSPAGRFRKDTSGTTFTLTNSFITANSILIITLASDPGAPLTHAIWTSCGAGSATITWDAAPTNNTDVNFFLVN